jgi:adenylate cyclase
MEAPVAKERAKRKLSGILSADAVGYSRLMQEDEALTIVTLAESKELMANLIKQYRGRVVDAPGDNLLAEFGSVVDATECAVNIQQELNAKNAQRPENCKMPFRIGVNLGDVVEEADRIYGDGVNIAARIEGLANGGGICVSGSVFDQIEGKIPLSYDYLGEQTVKNIKKPVRVYRVKSEGAVSDIGMSPDLPLPEKPSIAVLPFVNMSEDPEQEYFSDGITEEIITTLSKVPKLFVIARNSTFIYKGKSVNVQQVSRELGVRYMIEGSVRKMGDRVRITAQLIDAATGYHLWAERYDQTLKDIFAIQDEITLKIVKALQVKLTEGEQARLYYKGTENVDAYLKNLQAGAYFFRFDRGGNMLARKICEEVIALEPKWEVPYCLLGMTHWTDVLMRWSDSAEESIQKAFQFAQKALSLKESPIARGLLGMLYALTRQHEKAIRESERSIALDPNSADAHGWYAYTLNCAGHPAKAISFIEKALRLNPYPPSWYFTMLGDGYRLTGYYEEAIKAFKKSIYIEPTNLFPRIFLAGVYAMAGRKEEAQFQAKEVLRIDSSFSLEYFEKTLPHKNHAETERFVDALRKAGFK